RCVEDDRRQSGHRSGSGQGCEGKPCYQALGGGPSAARAADASDDHGLRGCDELACVQEVWRAVEQRARRQAPEHRHGEADRRRVEGQLLHIGEGWNMLRLSKALTACAAASLLMSAVLTSPAMADDGTGGMQC